MPDITLYRGISSAGIEDILNNGIHPYETKYDEARAVLSKYVNPEILTDEFLEENQDNIGYAYGNLGFRFRQFQHDGGVFCTQMIQYSDEEYQQKNIEPKTQREFDKQWQLSAINGAMEYAYRTAKSFPEYEWYLVHDLNDLNPESLLELEERIETDYMAGRFSDEELKKQQKRLECRKKIFENIKSKYKDENGHVNIVPEEGNYPVVLKINGNNREFSYSNGGEVRLAGELKPEDITGIAFAPEKMDELPVFVSKEEFVKQLQQRKEADNTKVTTQKTGEPKTPAAGSHLTDLLAKASGTNKSQTEPIQRKILSNLQPDI